MQPYFMPYIGYFQMIKAVDKFVFYDDVNYIKQGWINRNKILVNQKEFLFTVPLDKATSFSFIKDTKINGKMYEKWKIKFYQTLFQSYKKAPYFNEVNGLIVKILESDSSSISRLAINSVHEIAKYLQLDTKFAVSSECYNNNELDRKMRLLDICKRENATNYINAIGGQELYEKQDFLNENIQLDFIKSKPVRYQQYDNEFVPCLSMIDVLMFNSVEEINGMLEKYELV